VAILVEEELDGSRVRVSGGLRDGHGRLGKPCPQRRSDDR
jgi:hypothetical protein